jgi:hypothetical protein
MTPDLYVLNWKSSQTRFFLYLSFYLHSIDINRIKYIYIKITKGVYVKLVSASAPFTHA